MVTNQSHPAAVDKPNSAVAPGDGPYPALAGGQAEGFRGARVCTGARVGWNREISAKSG